MEGVMHRYETIKVLSSERSCSLSQRMGQWQWNVRALSHVAATMTDDEPVKGTAVLHVATESTAIVINVGIAAAYAVMDVQWWVRGRGWGRGRGSTII